MRQTKGRMWGKIMAIVLAGTVTGSARELFVATDDGRASDTNSALEAAPLKTIQAAVNLAKPGDTIWVKAGSYAEPTTVKTQGRRNSRITLAAWKDDRVFMGWEPMALPGKEAWTRIEGSKSWQVTLPTNTPAGELVMIFDGKPQPCQLTNTPPRDDQVLWGTYRPADRTLMVNAGGANPAEKHKLLLARHLESLIYFEIDSAHWVLRGFEFGHACNFVVNFGYNNLIEDCHFHHGFRGALFGMGYLSTTRRCTFDDAGVGSGPGAASVMEDNIFYRGGRSWDEDIHHRVMDYHEGGGGICLKGIGLSVTFRHNFCDEIGFWCDGNGTGTRIYGNAFHDNFGYAIYNEYGDDDTLIIGNYMGNSQAGVASSFCSRMSVIDNFIEGPGYGIVLHNRDKWQLRSSFMTLRGNAIVGSPLPLSGYGGGYDNAPEGWSNCLVDFNHYRVKAEGGAMLDLNGKIRCKTIEELRQTLGWELHGEAKPHDPAANDLTPESLGGGTVTVRSPVGDNGWKSRAMLSDPSINGQWPAAPRFIHASLPAFFWRVADGHGNNQILHRYGAETEHEAVWIPDSSGGYGEGEVRGCAWYVGADPIPGQPEITWTTLLDVTKGNRFLVVAGKTPEKMLPQGAGWWTPSLPTVPGAVVDISFKVRGIDLQPSGAQGGPAVWLQFTSLTGQKKSRVFLIGRDDAGALQNGPLVKGSYAWTEIKQAITAPREAGRMALFLGLRPAVGKVHFDDINLKTRPGEMPESAKKKSAPPPRLPLERFRETFFVDLAPFANRAFADDDANNGIGGWSDQGSNCDLREFTTGQRKFGGVPFNILPEPRSLVVLKSTWREAGALPEKVVIPVGRPADTLFFLHAQAWGGSDDDFRYILHYADGKDVTLTVGRKNRPSWAGKPPSDFPAEEGTQTVVAETVPSPQFGQGSMYRMEWNSPAERRGIKINSIEFAGSPGCVPLLGGITGVLEW